MRLHVFQVYKHKNDRKNNNEDNGEVNMTSGDNFHETNLRY